MTDDKPKIKLYAIYTKKNTLLICDQDGREFEGELDTARNYGKDQVIIEVQMEAPMYPLDLPHATISIRVPLKVEERLPAFMQEFMKERYG